MMLNPSDACIGKGGARLLQTINLKLVKMRGGGISIAVQDRGLPNEGTYMRISFSFGGGRWTFLEANMLGAVYGSITPGRLILSRFDLAVENLGSSIILVGLMANQTSAQVAELFIGVAKRGLMFVRNSIGESNFALSKCYIFPLNILGNPATRNCA
jgi:hypothetical protein